MHQLTISELQRNIGAAQDIADKEPVFITRNGREKYVLLSADEYHRLKRRDREVLGIEELSEEDIRAIAVAEVPVETAKLVTTGHGQAVRLPMDYRFDGTEVLIRRDARTGDVILSRRPASWDDFFKLDAGAEVPPDFMTEADRNQGSHTRDPFEDPPT